MQAGHFILVSVLQFVFVDVPIGLSVSSPQACHRHIEVLWATQARSSPVVSSPLIADVNGDNVKDVLVTSFGGEVMAVDGETGRFLPGWPVAFTNNTFHAAPLLVGGFMFSWLGMRGSYAIHYPITQCFRKPRNNKYFSLLGKPSTVPSTGKGTCGTVGSQTREMN